MERKFNQQDRHFLTLLVWLRSACALQIQAGKQVGKFGHSDNATRRPYSILNTSSIRRVFC